MLFCAISIAGKKALHWPMRFRPEMFQLAPAGYEAALWGGLYWRNAVYTRCNLFIMDKKEAPEDK
jgi:hypothetical protein